MKSTFLNYRILAIALLIPFLVFSLPSCKKKKEPGDNEKIEGTNKASTNLVPAKKGNWWLYKSDDETVSKTTVTGIDSFIAGNKYGYFKTVDTVRGTITPAFYAKNESEKYYLSLIDMSEGEGKFVSAIICTFDPKEGDVWTNTTSGIDYSGITVDMKTEGEVVSINKTMTINGKTFSKVVHTKNIIKAKTAITPWTKVGSINMYFVDGIGIIQSELDASVLTFFTKKINNTILDYSVQE